MALGVVAAGQSGSPAAKGGGEWVLEQSGEVRSPFGVAGRRGAHRGGCSTIVAVGRRCSPVRCRRSGEGRQLTGRGGGQS
jgi:hypothetical protein